MPFGERIVSRATAFLSFTKVLPCLAWSWLATAEPFRKRRRKLERYGGIWSKEDLDVLSSDIASLVHTDLYLRWRIGYPQPKSRGYRAWEYAVLCNYFDTYEGLNILDVGTGNSTYPIYFAQRGANVISLDLPDPTAPLLLWSRYKLWRYGVKRDHGNMLDLPYPDETFDVVTSISVIEHLNLQPGPNRWILASNEAFWSRTKLALREMARVLRSGGHLYVTSAIFLPSSEEVITLRDPRAIRHRAEYTAQEILDLWLPTLDASGLFLVAPGPISEDVLEQVASHDTKAPRHWWKPVAILARKR